MKMKKRSLIILICIVTAFCFDSCDLFQRKKFDEALLPGHWQSGTLHERYNADGSGYIWDTADDVTEEEAQPFNWTLTDATLTQSHLMEMGGIVPKTYTLTTLNATTLSYHDNYGKSYTFTKQP